MQDQTTSNKRIAKNTLFLYFRMFIIMGVSLYTSRVVLDKLGESDFGIFTVVGGVATALVFLNGTLSTSTSRFITYSLGCGDVKKLCNTFSTTLYNHLALGLFVFIILDTAGLWFLQHKIQIPPERMSAALIVYQLSLVSTFIGIAIVPYRASIIAHEKMEIYAYVSIFEAFAKLGILYFLSICSFDRLILYASLLVFVQIIIGLCYIIYCRFKFIECRLRKAYDTFLSKRMVKFSGWDMLANIVEMLKLQGVVILINMFFQPAVVAAQAIGNQVAGAMMQFVSNVRTAINPQIIKSYASGNINHSKKLTLMSAIYVYDLLLLIGLPLLLLLPTILKIWLVEVPSYTLAFARLIIIQRIISNFDAAFYVPMMASGKLRSNSMAAVFVGFTQFLILYILLKLGFGVMWVQYMGLIMISIYSFYIKPRILYLEQGYTFDELFGCYLVCIKVTIVACLFSVPLIYLFDYNHFLGGAVVLFGSVVSVVFASLVFMEKEVRNKIFMYLKNKF